MAAHLADDWSLLLPIAVFGLWALLVATPFYGS